MIAVYVPGNSPLHRLPVGLKLLGCLIGSIALAVIHNPWALAASFLLITGLYTVARLPPTAALITLRPLLPLLSIIFIAQVTLSGWTLAATATLRIASLVLLAGLVTLTSPLSAMIDAVTRAAHPLGRFGISPPKLGLAIALTMRFIPALAKDWRDVEDARAARGAVRPSFLGVGSLILRILCMTNALGDAIASRDFESRR
jgi:biotin transport system permease protein